jgi:hypothetical protein
MSTNVTVAQTKSAVIAIAAEENKLRAVGLRRHGGIFEVVWTKSCDVGEMSWAAFAAECGLSLEQMGQVATSGDKVSVVGFDSSRVVFYRIMLPAVKQEEIAAIIRLQVEARLPLSAKQMEIAWRADRVKDGQVPVTIAAARRQPLQEFVENVRVFKPAKILLDCEGIVKAWITLFSGRDEPAVIVSIGTRRTQVCLVEDGQLSNAVSLDIGVEDFSAQKGKTGVATAERFTQDIRSALEIFGYDEPMEIPVFVLSDGSNIIEAIVSHLGSAGFNVRASVPEIEKIRTQAKLGDKDIYEYRAPIGLAIKVLDGDTEELNIFERLYSLAKGVEKKHWFYSLKAACATAVATLVALVIVSYAVDVAKLNAIEKHLRGSEAGINRDLLVQRQKLIKTVAQQRPDLLGLLNEINMEDSGGITLDSLDFKKGWPVSISGQAQGAEQLYKFQKGLQNKKGITDVKIQSAAEDSKSKKFKFTITFHYKGFTTRRG